MNTRHYTAVMYLCLITLVIFNWCPCPAFGDTNGPPTAIELFDHGITQYEAGDLESAQDMLRRVDPIQLPKQQRLQLYEMLQKIDRQIVTGEPVNQEQLAQSSRPETVTEPVADQKTTTEPAPVNDQPAEGYDRRPQMQPPSTDLLAQARSLYAQKKVAEADDAARNSQYSLAIQLYQEAIKLDPENDVIRNKLHAAEAARNEMMMPRSVLEMEKSKREILTQATTTEFNAAIEEAQRRRNAGNYAAALDAVNRAKVIIDGKRSLLSPQQYTELRSQAENLAADIVDLQREAQKRQIIEIEQSRQAEAEQSRKEALAKQEEEVQELLKRAMELRREMKYKPALELVNQALFLEPTNLAAQAIKEMIEDSQMLVRSREIIRDRSVKLGHQRLLSLEATVPEEGLINYPTDWPQLTLTRLQGLDAGSGESEANRRTAGKLQIVVPINFEGNFLSQVIDFFRSSTGVDFVVNWQALENVGVEPDTPISLQLKNVTAEQALRYVLQQASAGSDFERLGFAIVDGIVNISTETDLSKTTDTRVYDIRDLLVLVPNFNNAPDFDLGSALSSSEGGGDLFSDSGDEEEEVTREELIENITTLIRDQIGQPEDWAENGGTISSLRELNGNLIVRTTPPNHRNLGELLAMLRETLASQISVEARFLLVDDNFLEEIGVDLDVGFHFDYNIAPLTGNYFDYFGGLGEAFVFDESSEDAITGRTIPLPFFDPRTAEGLGGTESGGDGESGMAMQYPKGWAYGNNWGPVRMSQGSSTIAQAVGTDLTPIQFLQNDSMSLSASFLDDLEVNLLVRATQANNRAISLTAPRVTFFNGQRAFVVVATQTAFVSDLEPVPDTTGFDITLSYLTTGAVLDVEGTISADRRYVTMTMRPSLATLTDLVNFSPAIDTTSFENTDNITFSQTIQAPIIEVTKVRSTVSVPDRGTVMVGGQRLVRENEVEAGVPVLSKIPILNRLFTNTSTVKDERTLLILVKPTIIIQNEEEEMNFPGLLQNPEGFNIGQTF